MMTPLALNILLHYRCSAEDFRDLDCSAIDEMIKYFECEGYLESLALIEARNPPWFRGLNIADAGGQWPQWFMTDKGRCYVDAILSGAGRLPVPQYVCELPKS